MINFTANSEFEILRFKDTVNSVCRQKLLALGMLPGTVLTVLNVAPMGGPIQLKIRGALFSLRRHEIDALEVVKHGS